MWKYSLPLEAPPYSSTSIMFLLWQLWLFDTHFEEIMIRVVALSNRWFVGHIFPAFCKFTVCGRRQAWSVNWKGRRFAVEVYFRWLLSGTHTKASIVTHLCAPAYLGHNFSENRCFGYLFWLSPLYNKVHWVAGLTLQCVCWGSSLGHICFAIPERVNLSLCSQLGPLWP